MLGGFSNAQGRLNVAISMTDAVTPKRILVVEDDLLNRLFFCDVLKDAGFSVEPVADEREALARTEQFRPDLIVMDIHMPHISGVDIIKSLKADPALQGIPVLAVTGYVGKGEEAQVRDAGAGGYLPKPVSIAPFVAAVNRLIEPEPV
jgi:two-component system cell cycle response regulator DivK